ncbi:hypothetical protein V2J09_018295 [Rumex salicifolius]
MDNHATESQQYQQYYQHYQQPHQQQPHQQQEATNPSAYDPSTQSYYASVQQYNPIPHQPQEAQTDYSSYYYPDYSNSYQSHVTTDPNSTHPPGVTIPAEMPQTHAQNHRDLYFRHWFENIQQQQRQQQRQQIVYMAPGHTTTAARGGRGGKPNRGGRHGLSRGRGKGRGGTRGTVPQQPSSSAPGQSAIGAARMVWCEICKVDCNTPEVLEQHKNGKKHSKNLKVYQELQSCSKIQVELQTPQIEAPDLLLVAAQPENKEGGSAEKQPIISDAVSGNSNGGVDTSKDPADKAKSSGAQASEEKVQIGGARGGIKRKTMRGGRGGKLMKCSNDSRKPAELVKPKKTVDLFCDLCNVKCESQVVFNSHMAGKKHLSNIKKLQGRHPAVGNPPITEVVPSTLQTLYPATPNAPSAPSSSQENQQRLTDAQALPSSNTLVNQAQDPQAALVELLNQHGIQDAHSLLSQMIPVLLKQVLPNVTSSAQPASGLGNVTQHPVIAHISSVEQNDSKSEMVVVDQSVQKTDELSEADKSNMGSSEPQREVMEPPAAVSTNTSTEQASI